MTGCQIQTTTLWCSRLLAPFKDGHCRCGVICFLKPSLAQPESGLTISPLGRLIVLRNWWTSSPSISANSVATSATLHTLLRAGERDNESMENYIVRFSREALLLGCGEELTEPHSYSELTVTTSSVVSLAKTESQEIGRKSSKQPRSSPSRRRRSASHSGTIIIIIIRARINSPSGFVFLVLPMRANTPPQGMLATF